MKKELLTAEKAKICPGVDFDGDELLFFLSVTPGGNRRVVNVDKLVRAYIADVLKPNEGAVLIRRFYDNMTAREIALALGVEVFSIYRLIDRGKKRLAALLAPVLASPTLFEEESA